MAFLLALSGDAGADASAGAGDTLTIEQCVQEARRNAPTVVAAELERQAAARDSVASSLNRRPGFSITGGALVAPAGFYDPAITNLGEYHLKAGADWALADGGARARARRGAGLDLAAARGRLALESLDAGLQAAGLAIRLLRLQELEELERNDVEWLDRLGALVRAGVTSGVRGSGDSIRVALAMDAAVSALESTRLETRTASLDLLTLLGRNADAPVAIRGPSSRFDRGPEPADSIGLAAAVGRQPEVALARVAEERGRLAVLEARRRNAPAVDLSVDAGLAGADLTRAVPPSVRDADPQATFADRLRRDLGVSASINLRLPVLDPAVRHAAGGREAALQAERVRREAEVAARRREALALLAQWKSAFRRVQALRLTLDRAEAHLLKTKSLYAAGAASLLDLLDARQVHVDARGRLAEARESNRVAEIQVEDRK